MLPKVGQPYVYQRTPKMSITGASNGVNQIGDVYARSCIIAGTLSRRSIPRTPHQKVAS